MVLLTTDTFKRGEHGHEGLASPETQTAHVSDTLD